MNRLVWHFCVEWLGRWRTQVSIGSVEAVRPDLPQTQAEVKDSNRAALGTTNWESAVAVRIR